MTPDLLYEQLTQIMGKEAEAHGRLLAAAQDLNRAAGEGNTAEMKKLTAGIDKEIQLIEQLEEERKTRCTALFSATGIQNGNLHMAQLIAKAPDRIRSRLSEIRLKLKELIAAIASINATNRLLLDEGARIAREHLSLVLKPRAKFTGYRQGGARTVPAFPPASLINRTA